MRKLIKLTALFTLLLLFYGTAFGGGWQKILNDGFTTQNTLKSDLTSDFILQVKKSLNVQKTVVTSLDNLKCAVLVGRAANTN
ncbi:MAG: hypothetical protein IPL21_04520 [Saprospirales bacterium]|nr:hypothetical protein [Saprospirales bacterium]